MELLEKIFAALDFTSDQKSKIQEDLNVLIKARTTQQLLMELPEGNGLNLTAGSEATTLRDFYTPVVVEERTRLNVRIALKEYIDFLLENSDESKKQAIAAILQEASTQ